jgi:hypothetical protein
MRLICANIGFFNHGRQWSAGTDARAAGAPAVEVDPLATSKKSPDGSLILHATHILQTYRS